jgi:hypothetical protein
MLEQSIIKELRPNIQCDSKVRLENIIDKENKDRHVLVKDDRIIKYLERRFGR